MVIWRGGATSLYSRFLSPYYWPHYSRPFHVNGIQRAVWRRTGDLKRPLMSSDVTVRIPTFVISNRRAICVRLRRKWHTCAVAYNSLLRIDH